MNGRTKEEQALIDGLWLALKMYEPRRAAGLLVSRADETTLHFLGRTRDVPAISDCEVMPGVFRLNFHDVPVYPSTLVPRGRVGIIESFREIE